MELEPAKKKSARVQVDPENVPTEEDERQGGVYNIWYQQWTGGSESSGGKSYFYTKPALGRCNPKKDSGYTRGDKIKGAFFCLHFAKGICPKGKKCDKLHRIPRVEDIYPPSIDCFGRKKHANYKEDMSGVGSFLRQNRTLYVARIGNGKNLEEAVSRHFSQFGEIDRIRVMENRQLAFVTYMNEANAQFAKEAMNRQSLDGEEILTVKWASEDPNPEAQKREKRRLEEQAADAIRKLLPEEQVKELEGDSEAVKRRRIEGGFGLEGYEVPDEVWYSKGLTVPAVEVDEGDHNPVQKSIESGDAAYGENSETKSSSIFSGATLESVKRLSSVQTPHAASTSAAAGKKSSALVDYDSE